MSLTTHDAVLRATSEVFEVKPDDLLGDSRVRDVAWPRQAAMYAARQISRDNSLAMIARPYRRDHTTVMHALKVTAERIEANPKFAEKVDSVIEKAMELCDPGSLVLRCKPIFKSVRGKL